MPPKMYNVLREEEGVWTTVDGVQISTISSPEYGELTFFDGSVNRLQWYVFEYFYETASRDYQQIQYEKDDYDKLRGLSATERREYGISFESSYETRCDDVETDVEYF